MDSVLFKFHGKNYYVKYDDLLNKANDKLFAYEDKELTRNAKLNGKTLMLNKKDMEDKLKNDIKMPIRMPSNLATEYNNMSKINEMRSIGKRNIDKLKKIMHSMWAKNYNVTEDEIIEALPVEWWDIWESADAEIRRLVDDFLNKLKHARSIWDESNLKENKMTNEQKSSTFKIEIINKNGPSIIQTLKVDPKTTELFDIVQRIKKSKNVKDVKILEPEGKTKMTNEQKLRKYIRGMIIESLKEDDPYGQPDEDKYLFKTGEDYLAGIQGESISEVEGEAPSAEELAAKQKAAEEKAKKAAYQRFFSQALAKFGYSGVSSIPDEKKKSFFDYVDQNWTSKQEAPVKTESFGDIEKYEIDPKHRDRFGDIISKLKNKPGIIDVSYSEGLIHAEPGTDLSKYLSPDEIQFVNNTDDWTDPAGGIHSFDDDDPAKMYESGTLNELWKGKLQKNYDDEYEQFLEYDEMYGIADRLGFDSAEEAWEANPTIQVGVNPKDLKVVDENRNEFIPAGNYVIVEPTAVGLKNSYPATNWLKKKMKVKLIDDAPNAGTLDVLDVELPNGKTESIYDFNIISKINETSSTGGVAGYETPAAFTGQKGISKKQKSIANQLGYELVDKSYAVKDQGDTQDLTEGKLNESYSEFEKKLYKKIQEILQNYSTSIPVPGGEIDYGQNADQRVLDKDDMKLAADSIINYLRQEGIFPMDENINLTEGMDTLYLKEENLTPEQKLGQAMRQVRNNLSEIENVVKRPVSLKKENNIGTENLGKRTYSSLKKIHETVTRLMVALNDMR